VREEPPAPVSEEPLREEEQESPIGEEIAGIETITITEVETMAAYSGEELEVVELPLIAEPEEISEGEDESVEPAEEEEERPKRGRRRGRRGRREKTEKPPATVAEGNASIPASAEQEEEESPRRRGRRSRKPRESEEEQMVEAPALEEEETIDEDSEAFVPAAEEDDEDDSEADKLADWNVPSWNELIASLYRPER